MFQSFPNLLRKYTKGICWEFWYSLCKHAHTRRHTVISTRNIHRLHISKHSKYLIIGFRKTVKSTENLHCFPTLAMFKATYTRKRFPAFSSNELVVLDSLENSKQIQKRRKTFPCVYGGLSFVLADEYWTFAKFIYILNAVFAAGHQGQYSQKKRPSPKRE